MACSEGRAEGAIESAYRLGRPGVGFGVHRWPGCRQPESRGPRHCLRGKFAPHTASHRCLSVVTGVCESNHSGSGAILGNGVADTELRQGWPARYTMRRKVD